MPSLVVGELDKEAEVDIEEVETIDKVYKGPVKYTRKIALLEEIIYDNKDPELTISHKETLGGLLTSRGLALKGSITIVSLYKDKGIK